MRTHQGIASDRAVSESPRAATGHRIGGRYYSIRNQTCYEVLGIATVWELAPGASVRLRWDNGKTTTTAIDRGLDPEVCQSCDGHLNGPMWIPVARCTCQALAPTHA
jgi:hypothetical protein